ncbi:hypothetical protein OC845_006709 [Tilletia horrida]|nr:hypothetical protein OC845_006709 [Tilletia horrida]
MADAPRRVPLGAETQIRWDEYTAIRRAALAHRARDLQLMVSSVSNTEKHVPTGFGGEDIWSFPSVWAKEGKALSFKHATSGAPMMTRVL